MFNHVGATTTGLLTTSGAAAVSKACLIHQVQLVAGASAAATVVITDGSGGPEIVSLQTTQGTTQIAVINTPVYANHFPFATLTGSGAQYIIHYTIV